MNGSVGEAVPHTGGGAWGMPRCTQQPHRLEYLERETVPAARPPPGGHTGGAEGGGRTLCSHHRLRFKSVPVEAGGISQKQSPL